MIEILTATEAQSWFNRLPRERRIATLSPAYVTIDARRDDQITAVFLGYREADHFWLHSVHQSFAAAGVTDQQSPYGYGGPLTNYDDVSFLARAWSAYVSHCRENDILAEFIRLHPMALDWQPYGGKTSIDRQAVYLDLMQPDLRAKYSARCRTAVHKAEKAGLTVTEAGRDEISSHFAEFYRAGMKAIGADAFYFFGAAYFEALKTWDSVHLLVCRQDDAWLSAGLFLICGDIIEYHLSATTPEGRRLAATNLLLDRAAHLGRDLGCKQFYLGGGTDNRADNPLFFFKSGFSKTTKPFRIASMVFQPDRYQTLKEDRIKAGKESSRILFYRD